MDSKSLKTLESRFKNYSLKDIKRIAKFKDNPKKIRAIMKKSSLSDKTTNAYGRNAKAYLEAKSTGAIIRTPKKQAFFSFFNRKNKETITVTKNQKWTKIGVKNRFQIKRFLKKYKNASGYDKKQISVEVIDNKKRKIWIAANAEDFSADSRYARKFLTTASHGQYIRNTPQMQGNVYHIKKITGLVIRQFN